jgi:hypothetical protein
MTVMDMAGFSVLKASSIFFLMVHPHTQACDLIHLDRQTHDLVARQTIPIPVEGVDRPTRCLVAKHTKPGPRPSWKADSSCWCCVVMCCVPSVCPSQLTKTYGEVSPSLPLALDPPYHVCSSLPSPRLSSTSHSLSPLSPCLQTLYKYYPGSLERLVVVNAPMGGQTIYRILTNVLPASFAEKVPSASHHRRQGRADRRREREDMRLE